MESLTLYAEDAKGGVSEAICYVSVIAVNDAPKLYGPAELNLLEDESIELDGLKAVDVDLDEHIGGKAEVTMETTSGSISLKTSSGLRFFEGTEKGRCAHGANTRGAKYNNIWNNC